MRVESEMFGCAASIGLTVLLCGARACAAPADAPGADRSQAALCVNAIRTTEQAARTPAKLLGAIASIESGRPDPESGRILPWAWTINAEGISHFYESKAEVVAAVQGLLASGVRSIDVGCMQINLLHHPDAFPSLDIAFDPQANVAYGARFLVQLYRKTTSWTDATAAYHSQTPEIGADYERRVMAAWPLAPRYAMVARPRPDFRVSNAYTAEFAALLEQDAADRAARNAALRVEDEHSRVRRGAAVTARLPYQASYTAEFAARLAQDAAARSARMAALHWSPSRAPMRNAGLPLRLAMRPGG